MLARSSLKRLNISRGLSCGSRFSSTAEPTISTVPNVWTQLSKDQRTAVNKQLDEKMMQDWKQLSRDEKRAAYYIAFGPHGTRTPEQPQTGKILSGVVLTLATSAALFWGITSRAKGAPSTMTKEWQEQTNEYLKQQRSDPVTGIASEDYKGKGFVQ